MKKGKRIASLTTASLLALTLMFSAACGGHTHTFADKWSNDETYHWHAATCEHTEEVSEKAPHTFGTDSKCSVCGYEKEAENTYKVTFHYGFDEADFDAATNTVKKYKETFVRETDGKKVTLTTAIRNRFKVTGYEVTGYSTDAWEKDGISSDIDVNVLYKPLASITVTFKNADGSVIKQAKVYEGEALAFTQYPDTTDPIYTITTERYTTLSTSQQSEYEAYGTNGDYILKNDKARLAESVVISAGKYFSKWEQGTPAQNGDYDLTASLSDSDEIIPYSTTEAVMDAQKDDGYELISELDHIVIESRVSGVSAGDYSNDNATWQKATATNGSCALNGKLYAMRGEDLIYFYAEVEDTRIVSNGKEYNELWNPWVQDRVELWIGRAGKITKLGVDAFGYNIWSTGSQGDGDTAYLDYLKKNHLFSARLIGVDNSVLEGYRTSGEPRLVTNATGYAVEFAIPCYEEPSSVGEIGDTLGSANWGRKMKLGETIYIGFQVNSESAVPAQAALDECCRTGEYRLSDTDYYAEHSSDLRALGIIAVGCQLKSFVNLSGARRLSLV